ncbi:hypothetical protein F4604DRAFT_1930297 [Suillus subluteus]|nr:hypothetical protein F4604DRAFT_1930297 [Suillus subluteus]
MHAKFVLPSFARDTPPPLDYHKRSVSPAAAALANISLDSPTKPSVDEGYPPFYRLHPCFHPQYITPRA